MPATTFSTITTTSNAHVTEGNYAVAWFYLSPPLAAAAPVTVRLTGWGTSAADFTGLQYSWDGVGWNNIASGGTLTLAAGSSIFLLRTEINTDTDTAEVGESLQFAVSQQSSSGSLQNSWWVESVVHIDNPPSSTPPTPAAQSTLSVPSTTAVAEGNDAVVQYNLSSPLSAAAQVKVSLQGWGTSTADYTGFQYSANGTTWSNVPANGMLTLAAGQSNLYLKTHVNTDTHHAEVGESLSFVVQQTTSGGSLKNSWWVAATVPITDVATPTGPGASITSITADAPTSTVVEATGAYATAKFTLGAALNTTAHIQALLIDNGATQGVDCTGFQYRTGTVSASGTTTWSGWSNVPSDLDISIAAGRTKLELRTKVTNDTAHESDEGLVFALAQPSDNLADSWWVTHTAIIQDNDAPVVVPPAARATITAPVSDLVVAEGQDAIATFHLSSALVGSAVVTVGLAGWGAAVSTDYGPLAYRLGTAGTWHTISSIDQITLTHGTTDFQLKTKIKTDAVSPEYSETVEFVVAQTSNATNLADSWWVPVRAHIADVAPGPVVPVNTAPVASAAALTWRVYEPATTGTETRVLPANLFTDADAGDTLTLSATQSDDSALPAWLTFDAAARTFTANLTVDTVTANTPFSTLVTATDSHGAHASQWLYIEVVNAVVGTADIDFLVGTSNADALYDLDGRAFVYPGGGDDLVVCGSDYNDVNDTGGSDTLQGGDGMDYMHDYGGSASDRNVLNGGAGNDDLYGSDSQYTLIGGMGDDILWLNRAGTSSVDGGDGNDAVTINDARGATTITLGAGNDKLCLFQTIGLGEIAVTDFVTGQDKITLMGSVLSNYTGVMANFVRITTNAAGHHVVEINQDGQGSDFIAALVVVGTVALTDLLL